MKYFLLILILFLPVSFTLAQINSGQVNQNLSIELKSVDLNPFSEITAEVNDYANTASTQSINWLLDGKTLPEFNNKRTINLKLKDLGQTTKLEVFIKTQEGMTISAEKTITPVYLDVIIEPQTHVPYFYKGRALPSFDSTMNFTALINGSIENSEKYIYNWNLSGVNIESGGAIGKYKTAAKMPLGQTSLLTLTGSRMNGELVAKKTIDIIPAEIEMAFYEVNSLFGLSQLNINNSLNLIGNSTVVRAEPYYLDIKTYNNPQHIEWKIDGNRNTGSINNPYEVTLAKQGGSGRVNVGFHVRNLETISQGVESKFTVNY